MTIVSHWTVRGYRVELHTDEDCTSPRENTNPDLIVTRKLRWALAPDGDETLPTDLDCLTCEGTGAVNAIDTNGAQFDCPDCYGTGRVPATFIRLAEWAIVEHGATVVLALDGPHDYGDRWTIVHNPDHDLQPVAIMFDPADRRDECGTPLDLVDEAMRADLDEYNRWAEGDCYGYVIKDVNGDEVDSCWGFIGDEYARSEANAAVPDVEAIQFHTVRLSAAQWSWILGHLPFNDEGPEHDACNAIVAAINGSKVTA